jgi:hypothetical protein
MQNADILQSHNVCKDYAAVVIATLIVMVKTGKAK